MLKMVAFITKVPMTSEGMLAVSNQDTKMNAQQREGVVVEIEMFAGRTSIRIVLARPTCLYMQAGFLPSPLLQ